MLAGNLVSQLHTRGGLPQWEVYVAATLPEAPGCGRSQAVRSALARNGPHWQESPEAQEFLVQEVGVPQGWLLESLSLCAKASGNPSGDTPPPPGFVFFVPCEIQRFRLLVCWELIWPSRMRAI